MRLKELRISGPSRVKSVLKEETNSDKSEIEDKSDHRSHSPAPIKITYSYSRDKLTV